MESQFIITVLYVELKNTRIKTDWKDGTILYNANTMILNYSSFSHCLSSSITSVGSRYNFAKDYSTNLIMRLGKNWSKNWKTLQQHNRLGKNIRSKDQRRKFPSKPDHRKRLNWILTIQMPAIPIIASKAQEKYFLLGHDFKSVEKNYIRYYLIMRLGKNSFQSILHLRKCWCNWCEWNLLKSPKNIPQLSNVLFIQSNIQFTV